MIAAQLRMTKQESQNRNIEFLDKDGFSALYRNGKWFFQKYHSKTQVDELCRKHLLDMVNHQRNTSTTSWQVSATKSDHVPLSRALSAAEFEFNLAVGESRTINRHDDVMQVIRSLYEFDS